MRTITVILVITLVPLLLGSRGGSRGLPGRVAQLEADVEALTEALEEAQDILQFVRVEEGEMNGLTGPHWIVEGANVHVQSGSGGTRDQCSGSDPDFPNCESLTGLGNLVVGYNEHLIGRGLPEVRTGSHNLVVGEFHTYTSFSGFVAGLGNRVRGHNASVSGGIGNEATGLGSSICGGHANEASGEISSVSGGVENVAGGRRSSVSGGNERNAPDEFNWAAGSLLEVE